MAVALFRALAAYCAVEMTPEAVAELACALEITRLRMPIGKQDQYASAFGGLNTIIFEPVAVDVQPLGLASDTCCELNRRLHEIADIADGMPTSAICDIAESLLDCHCRNGTIYFIGNGGSAATASHWVCDLAKGVRGGQQPSFRAISLTDNMPRVTAWGNDTGYERIFAEQLAPLARPGDLVVLISASGNSPNVLLAAQTARIARAHTIALTGRTGGRLRKLVDLNVRVPSDVIEQVEDVHVMIAHSVCVALRERLEAETFLPNNPLDIGVDHLLGEVLGEAGS